jgi:flagellar hook-associated protein 3 FlgL
MRVSTAANYFHVLRGIRTNQATMLRAQEQLASGRRLLRPSDDPSAAARALQLSRRLAGVQRNSSVMNSARTGLDLASSVLQDGSSSIIEARAVVLQGMDGTLSESDRVALASSIEQIRREMLEVADARINDRYLFGGSQTQQSPWVEEIIGGMRRMTYAGNREEQLIRIGEDTDVGLNVPGSDIFSRSDSKGVRFAGLTGITSGSTADVGSSYEYITVRHDSTDGTALAASGITLANGGADDTIMGANTLIIDPVAGTIQLGQGQPIGFPGTTDPNAADFVVTNEKGGELHLDMTGFNGAAFTGTVTGNGSVSIDGTNFVPLDFTEQDLKLRHDATGSVIHIDTRGIVRAGRELATFEGTENIFDVLDGIANDLRNADGLEPTEVIARLQERLLELDRNHENVLVGIGVLGSRSQRLQAAEARAQNREVGLQGMLSDVEDADMAEVALDLARSELTLQVAQSSGARLIQNSLLNYIR